MQLENYIIDLLNKYNKAVIPQFGLFFKVFKPSSFNKDSFVISMPEIKIGFNSQIKDDKGVLSILIAQQENIKFDEVVNQIGQIVNQWKNTLDNNQVLELKNIGTLRKNSVGGIELEHNSSYFNPQFGLSSIKGNYF